MSTRDHWERIYRTTSPDQVSWYSPHLQTSLELIARASPSPSAAIIDIGGGESTLADDLLARGYENITVLDISPAAIDAASKRLRNDAERIHWRVGDITMIELDPATFDLWHDRATFHFLTAPAGRSAYVQQVLHGVKPGGSIIIGTFGPEGPMRCSGLEVIRYDAPALQREFGERFRQLESIIVSHQTPFGTAQQFLYSLFRLV